jgi:DNA-binding transcriptional regulator YiaG
MKKPKPTVLTEHAHPDAIRRARLRVLMTPEEAARMLGYSTRAWYQWEAGKRRMRMRLLVEFEKIARMPKTRIRGAK